MSLGRDVIVRAPDGLSGGDAALAVGACFALFQGLQMAVRGLEALSSLMDRGEDVIVAESLVEVEDPKLALLESRVAELEHELELARL
jgi:hypothetical protein